jgi:hypothetical protein
MFKINKISNYEIAHYYSKEISIYSKANIIYYKDSIKNINIKITINCIESIFSRFRVTRRLFRLDKMNVFPTKSGLIILYRGYCYFYSFLDSYLFRKFKLRNCRNILHNAILKCNNGNIYFGEYGSNYNYNKVPIYVSKDDGFSWEVIFEFNNKDIRHIHGIFEDIYTNSIWICTGDTDSESRIIQTDYNFTTLNTIGSNTQDFRTCTLFFTEKYVYWNMDSHIADSYSVIYDRLTKNISKYFIFPGPVIYTKKFSNNNYMATTSQEIGPAVKDNKVYLYYSSDFINWQYIYSFEHDGFNKKYFKFGLITFSEGKQNLDDFILFGEAIKVYDGKLIHCSIINKTN